MVIFVVTIWIADNGESRVQEFWVPDAATLIDETIGNAVNLVIGQLITGYTPVFLVYVR